MNILVIIIKCFALPAYAWDKFLKCKQSKMTIDERPIFAENKIIKLCIAVKSLKSFTFSTKRRIGLMENPYSF